MNIDRETLKLIKEEIVSQYITEEELDKIKNDIYIKSQEELDEFNTISEEEQIDE